MINKTFLLSKQPTKNYLFHIIIIIITLTSIIFSYSYKTYDSLNIVGIYKCEETCYIDTSLSYEDIIKLNNPSIFKYNNKTYIIEDIIYNEPYLNNNTIYQDIQITSNLKVNKKIIKIKILYNKQRIITKIKNMIIGEE